MLTWLMPVAFTLSFPGRQRDGVHLEPGSVEGEPGNLDQGAGRPGKPEDLLPNRVDARPIGHVDQIHGHLYDVAEPGSCRRKHPPDVREHLSGLGDDVAAADQTTSLVDGDAAGDEQQPVGLHRIRVMADGFWQAPDSDLLPLPHRP